MSKTYQVRTGPSSSFVFDADNDALAHDHALTLSRDPEFVSKHGEVQVETVEEVYDDQPEPVTVDMRPNWKFAMRIYIMALENGTEEGKRAAREDLMKLADWVDNLPSQAAQDAPEETFVIAHDEDPDLCWDGHHWNDTGWVTFKSVEDARNYRKVHLHATRPEVAVAMSHARVQINPEEQK